MKKTLYILAAFANNKNVFTKMKLFNNFKDWKFKSPPNYAELPIDNNPEYNVPAAVKNAVFSRVPTEPLTGKLHLVCASKNSLALLDLELEVADCEEFVNFVAGKYMPEGSLTVCHRYGGYQFGFWADQLGDGRAHILGEYVNRRGESWQPQLKGSGETPYSRFGDGRAVLRSSIREMLASEACYHLGIPTTRAAALVVSDEHKVWRDKNYSGRAVQERASIVMRLSPAWYRIGSLEILVKRKEPQTMKMLVDFIIKYHFPEIDLSDEDKYVKWFTAVAHRNLDMVAAWQGFGFTHGVLNTDNVSLLGLTLDYGPYGFLDHYYEHYVANSSDDMGRYAFNRQADIMIWNLEKFADAMEPILSGNQIQKIKIVSCSLQEYVQKKILTTYLLKLGLHKYKDADNDLIRELLEMMQETGADFTATFRQLSELNMKQLDDNSTLDRKWSLKKLSQSKKWVEWLKKYKVRLDLESVTEMERSMRMHKVNPVYVPRNWIMQEAIADAEKNNFEKVKFLLKLFETPFEVDEEAERRGYSAQPPNWSYGLKLSCSS